MQQQNSRRQTGTALVAGAAQRLPYPADLAAVGVDEGKWRVLIDTIFPAAKSADAVRMAIDYCRARNLDVMKKPVHIVPMYSAVLKRMVETVWPSISEVRTTAARTGQYAGCDEAVFGDDVTETFTGVKEWEGRRENIAAKVTYPSWCRITVYKIVGGQRVAFPGPRVLWKESYARQGKADVPNEMWCKRPYGQLEKCAEAAALRKAFPEELGNEYAAEEMEGREIGNGQWAAIPSDVPPPPRPTRDQFAGTGALHHPGISPEPTDVEGEGDAETIDPPTEPEPPAEPKGMKPATVPLDDDGNADWARWQGVVLRGVMKAPDLAKLDEWWQANGPAFETFSAEHPEKADAMRESVELRRAELAPAGK